jgi:hypothetical protein
MNDPQAERELKPQGFEFESMNLQVGVRLQFITHGRARFRPAAAVRPHLVPAHDPGYELAAMRVKVDMPAKIIPVGGDVPGADCLVTNLSVNGARIESKKSLPQDEDEIDLEFSLPTPHNDREVRVRTRAAVRNISALSGGPEQAEGFAYGVQFVDLDPVHYTLLQNLTYEALLADRQKIV